MKNFFHFFLTSFVFVPALFYSTASAQPTHSPAATKAWQSPIHQNVFIENNGQFDESLNNGNGKILFNTSQGVNIYWNSDGLTYRATEHYLPEGARAEAKKEGRPEDIAEKMKVKFHYLDVKWIGANPNVAVSSEQNVSCYFTYANPSDKSGKSGIKASAYKKIIYKNIYPGIDIEYTLPDEGGIKYALIIHPGADLNAVKLKYNGAKQMKLNLKGEMEIDTKHCGNYLEHQPKTFYQNGANVNSSFILKNNIISFNVPSYDKTKTLIIDPWTTPIAPTIIANTNPSLAAQASSGYDIDYDISGNVWVFGGADPLFLAKYSNAGALIWVFAQPTNNLNFGGTAASTLVGDMCVNRLSGSAYISEGYADNGARIYKVTSQGMLAATFPGTTKNYEISHLRLNCSGKLYATGGGVDQSCSGTLYEIATIDTNLIGPMTGNRCTVSQCGDHDVNLMTLDPTGNFMYLNFNYPAPNSADYLDNNDMFKVPIPAFAPTSWVQPGPIYNFAELESMPYSGPSPPYFRTNTFNGIVCGNGFLYTYDGFTLKKWNKNTGAMIAQIATGGKQYSTGGLDLDLCENVYAGVGNAVKCYDSNLNLLTTYPLPDTSTYDLKVDKVNFKIYATGNSYVCSIDLPVVLPQLTTTFTPTTSGCGTNCNGTATASMSTVCASSSFSYLWMPGGETTATITGLCSGTYTVISGANLTCAKNISDTAVVTIPPAQSGTPPTAQFTPSAPCLGSTTTLSDGSVASATDPINQWSWSMPGGNPSSSTNQNTSSIYNTAGTHTVTLIVTTQAGCKDSINQQVVVYNPPVANFTGSGIGCAPLCVTNYNSSSSTSTDGNITNWAWSFPGGTPSTSTVQNPSPICYNAGGSYGASLIVTTQYGCSDTITISPLVNVYAWPKSDFCISPDPAQQPSTDPVFNFCNLWTPNPGVTNWQWNFGDGSPVDSINMTPTHSYSATATENDFYTYNVCLRVETQFGCWDSICKTVEITPEFEFYIPNSFTPNGDSKNEFFFGKCRGVKEYNIWIFDRWGNMIWNCSKTDKNTNWDNQGQDGLSSACQWDGTIIKGGSDMSGGSGALAQEDVYVWKVRLTDVFNKVHTYIGHVSVVK